MGLSSNKVNSSVEMGRKTEENHRDLGPNLDLGRCGDKPACQHIINTSHADTVPRCFQYTSPIYKTMSEDVKGMLVCQDASTSQMDDHYEEN